MLWTRALPGTVAVIAALTLPEFSLGAGDLAERRPMAQPAPAPAALAPSRPTAPPAALAPIAEGRPPQGLRALLAPVITPPAPPAVDPAPEIGSLLGIVPDVSAQVDPGLAAGIEAVTPPPVSRPLVAELSALVAQTPAAKATPAVAAALARSVSSVAVEAELAAPAPEAGTMPASTETEAAQRVFGGAKGSFAALAPNLATVPDMAQAPENAIIAAPTIPAAVRNGVPGRRPVLAEAATAAAAPDAAMQQMPAQQAPAVAEPQRLAPATTTVPAGLGPSAAVVPSSGPAADRTAVPLPSAATAPVAARAAVQPARAPTQLAAAPRAASPAPGGSAPVSARSAALTAPAPKAPVAALAARPPASLPNQARASAAALPAAPATPQARSVPVQAAPAAPLVRTKPQQAAPGLGAAGAFQIDVKSQLTTRLDGRVTGKVDFQQTDAGLLVRLGSIVELLGDHYDNAQIARIRTSAASDVYLSLGQLQAQGIPISYDPVYDEFNVGLVDTRPKAARKVHMDQISTPERGRGSTGIDQVRR